MTQRPPDNLSPMEAWKAGWRRYSAFRWWAVPFFHIARVCHDVASRGVITEWRQE